MFNSIQRKLAVRVLQVTVLALLSLALASGADAALLTLSGGTPDIVVAKVEVGYDPVSDQFVANGRTKLLRQTADTSFGLGNKPNSLQVNVTIDESGNATGGTIVVRGSNSTLGYSSTLLVSGTLLVDGSQPNFGYQDNSDGSARFQFRFVNDNTGALADQFGPMLGIDIDASAITFDGNFSSNFDNYLDGRTGFQSATADVMPEVPEPASLAIWSLLAATPLVIRRKRILQARSQQ